MVLFSTLHEREYATLIHSFPFPQTDFLCEDFATSENKSWPMSYIIRAFKHIGLFNKGNPECFCSG